MAWEHLWNEALNDTYRDMYASAHEIAPAKGIGWHIWHNNSFSPFYRAEQDYAEFSKYSDFLKVVIYNLCGGERLAQYVRSVQRTVFADFTPAQVLDFTYGVQQYRDEPLDAARRRGTRRGLRAARDEARRRRRGAEDEDLAGDRRGHSDRGDKQEDDARRRLPRREGRLRGRRARRAPLAKYSEMRLDNLAARGARSGI